MKNRTAYHALRFTLTLAALAGLAGSGSGTDMYWVGYQGCAEGAQEASFWNGDNWFGYVVPDSLDAAIFDPNYDPQDNGMPHVIHFGSFCVDQFSCPNPTHTPAKVDTARQLRIPDGSFIFDFGSGGDGCTPPNSDSGGLNIEWGLHLGLDNPGYGHPSVSELTIRNGVLSARDATLGGNWVWESGSGNLVLIGQESGLDLSESMSIGNGGSGSVVVSEGAELSVGWTCELAGSDVSEGYLGVSGTESMISVGNDIAMGIGGRSIIDVDGGSIAVANTFIVGKQSQNNVLNLQNGGSITCNELTLGFYDGGEGVVNIVGEGSSILCNRFGIGSGSGGSGELNVVDRGYLESSDYSYIGRFGQANGSATINNGTLVGLAHIASSGIGNLHVINGGVVNSSNYHCYIASSLNAIGTVNVSGSGSVWNNIEWLDVGGMTWDDGYALGLVSISNGGHVDCLNSQLGKRMDAVGQVSVSGPDSRWQIANQLIVGNGGIGQLTIEDHGQVTCANGVVGNQATANGTITISGAGANLVSTGSFNLGAAGPGVLTLVDGGAVEGHPFTVSSFGTLSGVGTVTGALVNNHLVQPGASPGVLSVAGSYNQGTAGTLEMEIAGPAAGSEHDLLAVSGAVTLSGTLQLNFLDGYTPLPGTQFDLITAGSISGQFASVLPCNETFRIDYLADRVRLTIVDWAATLHEGFESGDFSAQPWIQGGNQPWLVQNSLQHSGCFGAKSGAISHNQTSTLSLTQTVASESSISFWYQVSSQLNGDFLRFSIDGVQLGAWSGTVGWTQASYPVGPGTHTYQWAYTKNASVNTGSDCAWVDEILLPDLGDPQYPDYTTSITAIESTVIAGSQAEVPVTLGNTGVAALNWVASFSTVGVPTALEYMELEKGAEDPRVGTVSRSAGGPDAFGYRWRDSNQPDGPAYGWVDIQAVGTSPGIGDDTSFGPVALGFPFMFYGNTYNSVRITSNGNLSFTSSSTQHTNQGIPNGAAPNDMIAVFWDDLNVTTPSMLKYFADTANQRFIVQWTAVPRYNTAQFQTFQTILHSDGRIENHYQTVSGANSCTVGIENFAGTDGLQVVANADFLTNGLAIEFYPVEPWLSLTPGSGTVPAGSSADFLVTIDAASLALGSHDALVTVDSNDPDRPRLTLPVHVTVSVLEAPVLAIDFTAPDQVQLSWPAVSGATHYQVYSSTDGGASYSLLASTTELTLSLTISAAETRLFQVRAVR